MLKKPDQLFISSARAQALNEEVKTLSTQLQDILIDDLITAFENRFVVLNKTQSNLEFTIEVAVKVPQ
jgi:hypothetical protein